MGPWPEGEAGVYGVWRVKAASQFGGHGCQSLSTFRQGPGSCRDHDDDAALREARLSSLVLWRA